MIVCICRRISDRAVAAAIADGANTPAQVAAICGAGSECGGCRPAVQRMCEASCPNRNGERCERKVQT